MPLIAPFAFPLSIFRRAHAFAGLVLTAEGSRCRLDVDQRRAELTAAIVAAVADFISLRVSRFPRFTATLLARFASDRLPGSTVRALRRTAAGAFAACLFPPAIVKRAPARPAKVRKVISRFEIFVAAPVFARRMPPALYAHEKRRYREACIGASWRAVSAVRRERAISDDDHGDLAQEAQSAIGEFLGTRIVRFPRLASCLLVRFGNGAIPPGMFANLQRAAVQAVRVRADRLASRPAVAPVRRSSATEARKANRKIDALLVLVRVRKAGKRSRYAARCAQAHAALLEQHRADALRAVAA